MGNYFSEQQKGTGCPVWQSSKWASSSAIYLQRGANQLWELQPTTPDSAAFKIVSQATRKALTIAPGPQHLEDSVQVEQWPIDDQTSGQEWGLQLAGYDERAAASIFIIFAYISGKVLDVRGGSTEDHAVVQQYTPNGTAAQLWILQPV